MDKEKKEVVLGMLKSFSKGLVGFVAIDVERAITHSPIPNLVAQMAMEIVAEVDARSHLDRQDSLLPDMEQCRAVSDLVREYIRGLSDEEFWAFTSDEILEETIQLANKKLQSMMSKCGECNTCGMDCESNGKDEPDLSMN